MTMPPVPGPNAATPGPLPQAPPMPSPAMLPGPAAPVAAPSPMPGPTPAGAPPQSPPRGPGPPPLQVPPTPAAPPQPPAMPAGPLPPVQRTVVPKQPDASDSGNTFERLASLVVDKAADMAKRLSQNLNESPAGAQELTPEQVKAMWYFSPTGSVAKADATFWRVHDQVLAQTGDHNQAETQALQAAYPYRAQLAQVGVAGSERQVQLAEQLRKAVDGDQAPDSNQVAADHAAHATRIRQASGKV